MMVRWDPQTTKIVKETMNKPRWLTVAGALMKVLGPETVQLYGKKYLWWGDYHWRLYYSTKKNPYMEHVNYIIDFFKNKEGRFLDVGCGEGMIMKRIAEESKLECYGIDCSPLAIEFAHQHKIMNCEAISFEQFESDELYDFIFMGDFLEHVEEPNGTLERARELLIENGLILISFPIQKKKGIDDLHIFTAETARELVEGTFTIESFKIHKDLVRMYITARKRIEENGRDGRETGQEKYDPTPLGSSSERSDKSS